MKVSVIIPVHNAAKYLHACLDSVLKQTLTDLQVICVDDASTDESPEIVLSYSRRDSRVMLIRQPFTMYAGQCRNTGLVAATGEYVHFLDADDIVEDGAYQRYYKLAKETDADIVKGKCRCFDNDTGESSTTAILSFSGLPKELYGQVICFSEQPEAFSHVSVVPWNGLYKRTFLTDKGIWFNDFICVNDRSFFNEAVLAAGRIVLTRTHLVKYRINNSQSLVGNRARNFDCQFRSFALVQKQCEKYGIKGKNLGIILRRELTDLFIWYRKYRNVPEVQEAIIASTTDFARSLDMEPLLDCPPDVKWYYDYLLLTQDSILTVGLYLDGEETQIKECLAGIRAQSMDQFLLYGISPDGQGYEIFEEMAGEDDRFRGVLSCAHQLPQDAPYTFEMRPAVCQDKDTFKNYIKKIMESSDNLKPRRAQISENGELRLIS